MRLRTWLAALTFAPVAGAIAYGVLTDAREARVAALLERIESAGKEVPHTGVRVLEGGGSRAVLRVASRDGHRKKVEFLERAGGRKSAVKGCPVKLPCFGHVPIFPRRGYGRKSRVVKDYDLAARNYEVEFTGHGSVAGRPADLIEVRPRHPGRPSYRVAADAANRFPLRLEVLSGMERVFLDEFREIEYRVDVPIEGEPGPRLPRWLRVEREDLPPARVAGRAGFPVWRLGRLPEGFELRRSAVARVAMDVPEGFCKAMERLAIRLPKLDGRVVHFEYTDGIAVLSVVECSTRSEIWPFLRRFLPAPVPVGGAGKVVARRFTDRAGSAYILEFQDTAILVVGNVAAGQIEPVLSSLENE